jgi:hypothetical protein
LSPKGTVKASTLPLISPSTKAASISPSEMTKPVSLDTEAVTEPLNSNL